LKISPSTFFGFPASVVWSTSMIAKWVFGNCFATFATALAWSKADGDDEVSALARRLREVRDVRLRGRRLVDRTENAELALRALQPLVRELVEAVIVQLVDVGDEHDERLGLRRRGGRALRAARAHAVPGGERRRSSGKGDGGSDPACVHGLFLLR